MRGPRKRAERSCLIVSTILLLFGSAAIAQTPAKIIDRYVRALGGAKSLALIHSTRVEGTVVELPAGRSGSYLLVLESPDHLHLKIDLGSERWMESSKGLSGWYQDASAPTALNALAAKALQATAYDRNTHLAEYRKAKATKGRARLIGQELVKGRPAYHLEVVSIWGARREVFFDAETHLMVKEIAPDSSPKAQQANEEILYSDYRPIDNVQEPFHLELHHQGKVLAINVTKVIHNSKVDATLFNFPQKPSAPLPDIASLLKDLERNQKALEDIVDQYACRKTVETEGVEAGKKTVKVYEEFFLGGREIDRLAEKDGRALSLAEQQKEDDRVQKLVTKHQQRQTKKAAERAEGNEKEDKDEVSISTILRASRFINPRREIFRGQEVIAFDFEPNPRFKPSKLSETVVHALAGSVWIDEQAHEIVRLEGAFREKVNVGGGLLVKLQQGSAFVFEQQKVNNEVWLPSYTEIHASVRVLLLKSASPNIVMRYSDYKKFRVENADKNAKLGGQ